MLPLLSLALVSAPSAAQALPGHRKQPANLQLTLLAAAVLPRALSHSPLHPQAKASCSPAPLITSTQICQLCSLPWWQLHRATLEQRSQP